MLLSILGIALNWIVLGLTSLGAGLLLRRLFCSGPLDLFGVSVAFWTGWAAIVAFLQIWHLALPVNRAALALVLISGGAGLLLEGRPLARLAWAGVRRAPFLAALLILALLWVANRSAGSALSYYDLGLYYLQAVQWNSTYPIVPGLGNLHERLAFNSAYFLYGTLVDQAPFSGGAERATDGLLVFALLAQSVVSAAALATGTRLRRLAFWNSLTVVPALNLSFPSLIPDQAIVVLGCVLAGLYLAVLFEAHILTPGEQWHLSFALTLLACIGIAVKLSFAVFAAIVLVVGLSIMLWRQRRVRRIWLLLLAPPLACALLVGGIWMARGVILSGYPVFPSTLGAFPVPWRIPDALAINTSNWIRSWARQPGVHWVEVLGNQKWLQPWLDAMPGQVVQLLQLALVSVLLSATTLAGPRLPWRSIGLAILWLLPALGALIFWFISAPDYRFAGAVFWVIGLGSLLLAVERLAPYLRGELQPVAIRLALVGLVLLFIAPLKAPLIYAPVPGTPGGILPIQTPPYEIVTRPGGLSLVVPVETDQCWMMPLPCTPYPRSELRLREPGNLAAGFMMDPACREFANYDCTLPAGVHAPASLGVSLPVGWHAYEPENGVRWMKDEGMILLYSDTPRRLRLALQPHIILGPTGWLNHGHLSVAVEGVHLATVKVQGGEVATLPLVIPAGFTRVALRLESGAHVPAEVYPSYGDTRRLSIALSSIELSYE